MLNSLAYSQYSVSEHLWSVSDEILLVRVLKEQPDLLRSITTCTSEVTVEVVNRYKTLRLGSEEKQLTFSRLYYCSMESPVTDGDMLKQDKQYVIFLSSEKPGTIKRTGEAARKIYSLTDLLLGVLEYSKDLEEYLQSKQREKH